MSDFSEFEAEKRQQERQQLMDRPFNHRTDVSADAKYIVRNLWIIFVLLPFVLGVAYQMFKAL